LPRIASGGEKGLPMGGKSSAKKKKGRGGPVSLRTEGGGGGSLVPLFSREGRILERNGRNIRRRGSRHAGEGKGGDFLPL